jgi:hypothetical protein
VRCDRLWSCTAIMLSGGKSYSQFATKGLQALT